MLRLAVLETDLAKPEMLLDRVIAQGLPTIIGRTLLYAAPVRRVFTPETIVNVSANPIRATRQRFI